MALWLPRQWPRADQVARLAGGDDGVVAASPVAWSRTSALVVSSAGVVSSVGGMGYDDPGM